MRTSLILFVTLLKVTSCQRRIVGGTDAEDGMYPYAAFVLIGKKASCTGSLLTAEWVLTAAHCLGHDPKEVQIFAGAADRKSKEVQVRFGKKMVVHSKYTPRALGGYDIALVMVFEPFNMSLSNIGTIPLMSEEWPQNNQMDLNCKALGWGRLSTQGKSPDILQHVDVVARHGENACPCVRRFEQKKVVCLKGKAGVGPCMGDSGGPLVCGGKEVGITHVGFTKEKCNPIYHDVPKTTCGNLDTVVTYFYICPELDWIKEYVPGVPAKPKSCSAIQHSSDVYLITILVIFVPFPANIFYL